MHDILTQAIREIEWNAFREPSSRIGPILSDFPISRFPRLRSGTAVHVPMAESLRPAASAIESQTALMLGERDPDMDGKRHMESQLGPHGRTTWL
jgi:hypothetical protein